MGAYQVKRLRGTISLMCGDTSQESQREIDSCMWRVVTSGQQ